MPENGGGSDINKQDIFVGERQPCAGASVSEF